MTREKFLTVRWNNILTIVLGLVILVYIIATVSAASWTGQNAFIGLSILGALY